jgi:hypothetical protein
VINLREKVLKVTKLAPALASSNFLHRHNIHVCGADHAR